jgi:NitT/TauT family transport system substrate-binding protein
MRAHPIWILLAGALGLPVRAPASEQISVTHWGVLMYGVPYAVAMEKGFFKEGGVDIDGILTSKGGGTTVRNVLASGLPYGEVSLAAAVAAAQQGIDIRIVNAGARTVHEILWVTMPDSPYKSLKDVAGKKVAYTSPKSVTDMLLLMSLDKVGMKPDSVERVAAGGIGAGLTALEKGGVAAAPTMDPVWARTQSRYRPLFWVKDLLPPMTQTVGITTADFAAKHADKLRAIIAGRRKAVDFIYAHPALATASFAAAYDLDPQVAATAVKHMIEIRFWSPGDLEMDALDRMIAGLRIVGEVEGKVDWDKLVDERFLPPDLRRKK